MDTKNIDQYYGAFKDYWYEGYDEDNLDKFKNADSIMRKMLPSLDGLIKDDNKIDMASVYKTFCEFLFDYLLLKINLDIAKDEDLDNLKKMAVKTLSLDPNNFDGNYYMVIFRSYKLRKADSGEGPALYKTDDIGATIVGTAINILGKGLRFGVTATSSEISKGNFFDAIEGMINAYRHSIKKSSYDPDVYIDNSNKMINIAEYCDENRFRVARSIYSAINEVDFEQLDFSVYKEEYVDEKKKSAFRISIVSDSKAE
jgi:hypothetical protein